MASAAWPVQPIYVNRRLDGRFCDSVIRKMRVRMVCLLVRLLIASTAIAMAKTTESGGSALMSLASAAALLAVAKRARRSQTDVHTESHEHTRGQMESAWTTLYYPTSGRPRA